MELVHLVAHLHLCGITRRLADDPIVVLDVVVFGSDSGNYNSGSRRNDLNWTELQEIAQILRNCH